MPLSETPTRESLGSVGAFRGALQGEAGKFTECQRIQRSGKDVVFLLEQRR